MATFTTTPSMSSRVTLTGGSWVEPIAGNPQACRVTYAIGIKVNILAFSSLLEQGLEQFRLWTGRAPPRDEMEAAVFDEVERL